MTFIYYLDKTNPLSIDMHISSLVYTLFEIRILAVKIHQTLDYFNLFRDFYRTQITVLHTHFR